VPSPCNLAERESVELATVLPAHALQACRLANKQPEAWIVKGGFDFQLRLGARARTTKDIDVSATNRWTREETTAHLRAVASLAFGDWFEFQVSLCRENPFLVCPESAAS